MLWQSSKRRKLRKTILQSKHSTVKLNKRKPCLRSVKTRRQSRKCKNTKSQCEPLHVIRTKKEMKVIKQAKSQKEKRARRKKVI